MWCGGPHTSNEEHVGLLADSPHLIIIIGLVVNHVDGLLHIAQHQIAMAVVCLCSVRSVR